MTSDLENISNFSFKFTKYMLSSGSNPFSGSQAIKSLSDIDFDPVTLKMPTASSGTESE